MGVNGLYGLSGSGLDIESMVKAGMLSKQNQYDKMYKKEVKNEWLKQGFNEIYTSLNTFKYSTLSDYKLSSNMNAMGAESKDSSVVKATANGDAVAMTHNVEVKQLSQNAYLLTGNDGITRNNADESKQASIYLRDVAFKSLTKNDDGSFKVTFADGSTRNGVSGTETAISFLVQDDDIDVDSMDKTEKGKQTIHYTFEELFERKTLNDLAADIKNLNTNVSASYDATNDAFTMYNKESGTEATIKLTMGSSDSAYSSGDKGAAALFNALNLHVSAGGELTDKKTFKAASDAADSTAAMKTNGSVSYVNTEAGNTGALKDFVLKDIQPHSFLDAEMNPITDDEGNPIAVDEDGQPLRDGEGNYVPLTLANASQYTITKADGTTANVGKEDTAISFSVTSGDVTKSFAFTYGALASQSMSDIADLINNQFSASGANVTASYDAENGFSITSAGGNLTLAMGTDDGNGLTAKLFTNLKLGRSVDGGATGEAKSFADGDSMAVSIAATTTAVNGTDGIVTIDGREYKDVKDGKITVSGVTYALANVGKTTVSVTQDTDKIIDSVKKFVEDYNKILDDLTKKYNTKPAGDYEPLSKTQEAGMTQEQIDKWTEKAKEGLFYHNDILRGLISDMRDAIMTPVQSVHSEYNSASAIGITSTNNQGHLTLDVDKLKKALAADPDCVYEIFASDQDTYTDETDKTKRQSYMLKDDYNNRGIANRLYFNAVTDGIKKVEDYAGVLADSNDQSTLGLLITQLKDKMTNFKALMDDFQTQLYKKYDALEVMISRMNSQYNTLFGGQQ